MARISSRFTHRFQQDVARSVASPAMKERLAGLGAIPSGNAPACGAKVN